VAGAVVGATVATAFASSNNAAAANNAYAQLWVFCCHWDKTWDNQTG
jgi:hypothetical protein